LQPLFLRQKNLGGRGSKVLSGQKRIVRRPNEGQTIAGQRICGWITQPAAFRISVLLAAIGLPGLFRIALNRAPFSGDESQYARASVELFRSLAKSPLEWLHLLITISPYKPSALLWLGQFFVPLGSWAGSIDRALLLCIWCIQLVTLGCWRSRYGKSAAGSLGNHC